MAITSNITKTLQHPTEPGVTVTIRMLSHSHVERARRQYMRNLTEMADLLQAYRSAGLAQLSDEQRAAAEAEASRPGALLDRATVIECGVVQWSYEIAPQDGGVAELDEDTAQWLFDEIVQLSFRPAAEKKASSERSQHISGQGMEDGPSN